MASPEPGQSPAGREQGKWATPQPQGWRWQGLGAVSEGGVPAFPGGPQAWVLGRDRSSVSGESFKGGVTRTQDSTPAPASFAHPETSSSGGHGTGSSLVPLL